MGLEGPGSERHASQEVEDAAEDQGADHQGPDDLESLGDFLRIEIIVVPRVVIVGHLSSSS